jgi:uncharacterized protein with beta-barrel porin domain
MSTANSSGLMVVADRRRKSVHQITIGEADGDDVVVAANDNVRIKIGRAGDLTPILEIESDAATANGSVCTAANATELTLFGADLTAPAGIYDIEVAIVDTSDGDKIKKAERGIFVLRESMGGDVD